MCGPLGPAPPISIFVLSLSLSLLLYALLTYYYHVNYYTTTTTNNSNNDNDNIIITIMMIMIIIMITIIVIIGGGYYGMKVDVWSVAALAPRSTTWYSEQIGNASFDHGIFSP